MLICMLTMEEDEDGKPSAVMLGLTHADLAKMYTGGTVLLSREDTGLAATLELFLALGNKEEQIERFREIARSGGAPPELLEQFQVEDIETPERGTRH